MGHKNYSARPWFPRITVYRVLLTTVTVALSTAKALCPSRDTVTLDWIVGIVLFLLFFFLSYPDRNQDAKPRWLFTVDVLQASRKPPTFDEEHGSLLPGDPIEPSPPHLHHSQHPAITGYRILVTLTITTVGSTKAYLAYRGTGVAPNAIEWAYGGVVSLILYWVGLYEDGPRDRVPSFFVLDRKRLATFAAKLFFGPLTALLICWATKHSFTPLLFKLFDTMSRLHVAGHCFYEAMVMVLDMHDGWRPKVTVYRLLLTASTVSLGTAKALSSVSASVTLEWVAGVVLLLLVFFLSYCDESETSRPSWLFQADIIECIQCMLNQDAVYTQTPRYPDEFCNGARPRGSVITAHRLLVTSTAIAFGTTKAYLSFEGSSIAPKALEWAYGVIITLVLYWLGLYEDGPRGTRAWYFEADFAPLARFMVKLLGWPTSLLIWHAFKNSLSWHKWVAGLIFMAPGDRPWLIMLALPLLLFGMCGLILLRLLLVVGFFYCLFLPTL